MPHLVRSASQTLGVPARSGGGTPSPTFQGLLNQLEVEHAREVMELQEEICRLRTPAGQEADTGVARVRMEGLSVRHVDDSKTPTWQACSCSSDGDRSPSPPRHYNNSGSRGSNSVTEPLFQPVLPCETRSDCGSDDVPRCLRLGSTLTDDVREQQLLKVKIVGATGVLRSDGMKGKLAEPYCTCSIVGKPDVEFRTHVVDATLNPVWNYEAVIDEYTTGDSLNFVIHDHKWLQTDYVLGSATLQSSAFCDSGYDGHLLLHLKKSEEDEAFLEVSVELSPKREVFRTRDAWVRARRDSNGSAAPGEKRALLLMHNTNKNLAEDMLKADGSRKRVRHWGSRWVFDPSSAHRLSWDAFGILLVCWDMIWLPLQAFQPHQTTAVVVLGWIVLLYWTCDILVTFNTGAFKKGGYLTMNRKDIAWSYLRRWFIPDLVIVTTEWLLMSDPGASDGAGAARAGRIARASRSVRLLRLMRLAKLRELLFSLQAFVNSEYLTVVFSLSKNFLTILVLTHVLACLWFMVGSMSESGWVYQAGLDGSDFDVQYLVSLQWSMAQFTPGASPIHPHTIGERCYSVGVLALGLVVATCFVSTITSTVSAVWAMQRNESTQAFLLKKFLRQNNVSRSLGSRVTRYIDCVMELRQQKVHPTRVQHLSLLSGPLHVELQSELREPQVFIHKMFPRYKEASVCAFREVCTTALQQNNFAKNDMLFHHKAEAKHMYFLNSGTLVYRVIVSSRPGIHDQQKSKLEAGQWCCENALWMPWQHAGDMKAVSDVDVTLLSVARFCEVTNSDPEAHQFATAYCSRFMEKMQQAASFDAKAVTDLPLRVHILGVDHGEPPEPPRRLGTKSALTPAARFLQEAEDMEAELIAFPDPEPEKQDSKRSGDHRWDQARTSRNDKPRFSLVETLGLAHRCLTPRLSRNRARARTTE